MRKKSTTYTISRSKSKHFRFTPEGKVSEIDFGNQSFRDHLELVVFQL